MTALPSNSHNSLAQHLWKKFIITPKCDTLHTCALRSGFKVQPNDQFSVITPALNSGIFLGDNLISVGHQKFLHEHIVQDGGSSDSTLAVFKEIEESYNLTKTSLISASDQGQSDALNQALAKISGKYVGWLNADEFYMPDALEIAVKAFEKSGADVIYGDCYFVDENANFVRLLPSHNFSINVLRGYGCFISSCATFVKSSVLKEMGFDTRLVRSMDWDLWLRLSENRSFHYEPFPFAAFRIHPMQVTAAPVQEFPQEFSYFVAKHHLMINPIKPRLLSFAKIQHAIMKLTSGGYIRQHMSKVNLKSKNLRWW